MAGAMGLDLEEEAMSGRLDMEELTDVVLSCTSCSAAEACNDWLAEARAEEPLPPVYCRNSAFFRVLRATSRSGA